MEKIKLLLVQDTNVIEEFDRYKSECAEDFIILHATTLEQTFSLINQAELLIVDLELPGFTPEVVFQELIKSKRIPMVIISGATDVRKAYDFGKMGLLGGYLIKPVSQEQLLVAISWALGLYRRLAERIQLAKDILNGKYDEES